MKRLKLCDFLNKTIKKNDYIKIFNPENGNWIIFIFLNYCKNVYNGSLINVNGIMIHSNMDCYEEDIKLKKKYEIRMLIRSEEDRQSKKSKVKDDEIYLLSEEEAFLEML